MRRPRSITISTLLVLTFLLLAAVAGATGGQVYTNPVHSKDFPDPHVFTHDGRFYAYATQGSGHHGFQVMESTDLVTWTHRGIAFKPPWSEIHFWAPEVVKYRGQFYMTYSAKNPNTGRHDIGMAVAGSPLGPFEHRSILVSGGDNQAGVIDATVFFDVDNKPYLIYSEEEPRTIALCALSSDLLHAGSKKVVLIRPDLEWEGNVTEAPTMVRRDGIYYLFYSGGWYQSTKTSKIKYAVAYATAKSLEGPYTKNPEPILQSAPGEVWGPGHQCVVEVTPGDWWMIYHGWNNVNEPKYGSNPSGRTMRIDRLVWFEGKPRVIGPTSTPRPAPFSARTSKR